MIPGGANSNRAFLEGKFTINNQIDSNLEHILFDPQTSGGMFMAIPGSDSSAFETDAKEKGIEIALIGVVESKSEFSLIVE
jgi:selenide,water dikinase